MGQRVEVPDVGTLEFPDGMSHEQMRDAIYKNFPQHQPRPQPTPQTAQPQAAVAPAPMPGTPSVKAPTPAPRQPTPPLSLPPVPARYRIPPEHPYDPRSAQTPIGDLYEKWLGAPAQAGTALLTGVPSMLMQGGRGLYGMATGEDPLKTVEAQERIGAATTYRPPSAAGRESLAATEDFLGAPTRVTHAEEAAQYLARHGHPWLATGARIALDPWSYAGLLPAVGELGLRPPRPPGARVEPGMQGPPPEIQGLREHVVRPGEVPEPPGRAEGRIATKPIVPEGVRPHEDITITPEVEVGWEGEPTLAQTKPVEQAVAELPGAPKVEIQRPAVEKPRIKGPPAAVGRTVEPAVPGEPPRPPAAPTRPEYTTPYDMLSPDDQVRAGVFISGAERRMGGVETGEQYRANESIGFSHQLEKDMFETHRYSVEKDVKRSNEAFSRLQDRVKNMTPEEEADYAYLKKMNIPDLKRAAQRYHDQVRTQLEAAARDNEGQGIGIKARPYDASIYKKPAQPKAGPPEPPPAPGEPPRPPARDPRLAEADADYQSSAAMYKRQRKSGFITEQEYAAKMKGLGMRKSALEREVSGKLTVKEAAAKEKREAGNYKGKEVTAGGQPGTVEGMAYGSVRVKMPDGTVRTFGQEQVTPREAEKPPPADDFGPGTLGANPMFNPRAVWNAVKETTQEVTGITDATQLARDESLPAVGAAWQYDNHLVSAQHTAMADRIALGRGDPAVAMQISEENQQLRTLATEKLPKMKWEDLQDPREISEQNEAMRRVLARQEFQRKLVSRGQAAPYGVEAPGLTEVNLWATQLPNGTYLKIDRSSVAAVKQMAGAMDQKAFETQSKLGRAIEQTSRAVVAAVMIDPAFHMATVAGRMIPFEFKARPWATPERWAKANAMLADRDAMASMIRDGYRPMSRRYSDLPTGSELGAVESMMSKAGITGKAYEAWKWSHDLMVNKVNQFQAMFYDMTKQDLIDKGFNEQAAHLMAIRKSNMMSGNLSKAEMRPSWYKGMGSIFFSRGYTSTVLRQLTRAVADDRTLRAALQERGMRPADVERLVNANRNDLQMALLRDYVTMWTSSNLMNYVNTARYDEPDKNGKTGGHFIWDNKGAGPIAGKIMPESIFWSRNDQDGSAVYLRMPFRTTLDQLLFMKMMVNDLPKGQRPEWLFNKMHPMPRGATQQIMGEGLYGQPMGDVPSTVANIGASVSPFSQAPFEAAEAYREGSPGYFGSYLLGKFADVVHAPETLLFNAIGGQMRRVEKDYEVKKGMGEVIRQEKLLTQRASEIRKNWKNMSEEERQTARESIRKSWEDMGRPTRAPPWLGEPRAPTEQMRRATEAVK